MYRLMRRSQWSRDIKWRFVAARILSLLVRIPQRTWMSVCCGCCLLSGRGLCDELIISSEEYFRLRCVFVLSINSWIRRPWPTRGSVASKTNKQTNFLCTLSQKPAPTKSAIMLCAVGTVKITTHTFWISVIHKAI